jgi:hypothetical protein
MMEELVKAQATALLNKISEAVPVRWDRLTDEGPRLSVYGWIDRKCPVCPKGIIITDCEVCEGTGRDRRADFVLMRFETTPDAPGPGLMVGLFTSSAEHSEAIARALWGDLAEDVHVDCKRVEHELPDVKAAIEL